MKVSQEKKKIQDEWLSDPTFKGWLRRVPENEFKCKCAACNVEILCGKSELHKHIKSQKHSKLVKNFLATPSISGYVSKAETNKGGFDNVKQAEIKLATFFAEHNVAFQVIDHVTPLVKEIFPDSKIAQDLQMKRSKCTNIIKKIVAKVETDEIVDNIKTTPFSVLVDESTDISLHKFLCVLVRYISPITGRVITQLLELVSLDARDGSAEKIYLAFKECLTAKGIPLKNIVGISCDGANVMIGVRDSFFSRLKHDINDVVLMQCICHSAALVASKACEKLPRAPEELLRNISSYLSHSSKRCAQLVEIQEFMNLEKKKILKPAATRWLALHQCVCRVIEYWSALQCFFNVAVFEDKLKSADFILSELNNLYTKAYLLFLKYVLNFINSFNALFQSRKILIHSLTENSTKLLKQIGQNFLSVQALQDIETVNPSCPRNFLPLGEVYLGPESETLLKELPKTGVDDIRKRCLEFYIVVVEEIQKRLPIKDPMFKEMTFLCPTVALGKDRNRPTELAHLVKHFSKYIDVNDVAVEWRLLPHFFSEDDTNKMMAMDIDAMWDFIANAKDFTDELKFSNIGKLAKLVLTLPHSNAEAERIFSIVSDVKTKKRNRIGDEALGAVAVVRSAFQAKGLDCCSFKVTSTHLSLHNSDVLY